MKLVHENIAYELTHKEPVPRVRAAFAAALQTMPKQKAKKLQEKMLKFTAANAEEGEEFITVQIRAIKSGEIDVNEILSVSEPMTPEEVAAEDAALVRMFCAIVDTNGLPQQIVDAVAKGCDSEYFADNLNMKEVKAFVDSFRSISDF